MVVLDANILIRAVLGSKVLALLRKYVDEVLFVTPDVAFLEAREHLPGILASRRISEDAVIQMLALLTTLVQPLDPGTYTLFETEARERLDRRDSDDWPVLAAALALRCPIWTEDKDFFGCGVATWTTDRVELYLAQDPDQSV